MYDILNLLHTHVYKKNSSSNLIDFSLFVKIILFSYLKLNTVSTKQIQVDVRKRKEDRFYW